MKAIIVQFTFGLVAFDEKYDFKEIILFKGPAQVREWLIDAPIDTKLNKRRS